MGTTSTKKFIKDNAGQLTEEHALTTSAGAADADSLPALNANGVLDITILNGTVTTAGVADAGKTVVTDGSGKIDATFLPTGIGPDVAVVVASEALVAGALVNIWSNGGTGAVRNADGSTAGKEAHGFVEDPVASGAPATVFFEGTNDQMTGLTPGNQFLSATTPGHATNVAPSAAGQVVQRVGFATSATSMNFQSGVPILKA